MRCGNGEATLVCMCVWRGAANTHTAPAATSTAPVHQRLGSANAETTPAGAQAAAAHKTQRPDTAREPKNG